MPKLLKKIMEIFHPLELYLSPERDGDPLASLMQFKENYPKYAMDREGNIIGLNLARTGLTDEKWEKIISLPGLVKYLQRLNLCDNRLISFDGLPAMKALHELNLSENKLLEKISFSKPLPRLERLDLGECKISSFELPNGFYRLKWLNMRGNGLNEVLLPSCPALEFLDLSQNKLCKFVLLRRFKSLKYLYLNNNLLDDIAFNADLFNLEILHLRNNQFSELPLSFFDHLPNIQTVYMSGNPLPDALLGFLENDARQNSLNHIRRYLRELSGGSDLDNEYKILLIGNGNVGKTCFVERLVYNRFLEKWESTHAISLEQYPYEGFLLNLWDFGGQDMYHSTHRLFMQSNAIYLLLWDWETEHGDQIYRYEDGETRTYENYPLSYWLDYARSIGGQKSAVIVVQTKILEHQKHEYPGGIQEKYYTQFAFFDCHQHIDSKESDKTKNGFKKLLVTIEEALTQVKSKKDIPLKYSQIRRHLRHLLKSGQKYLDLDTYLVKATDLKIEDPVGVLENWLAKTGVVFYKHGLFENKIILDQAWAIEAIYTLFKRNEGYFFELQVKKGAFSGKDLERYWHSPITHNEDERTLFVSFMLSCEMCFETTPKPKEYSYVPFVERSFIIPQLLPEEKPRSVQILERRWKNSQIMLHLRFRHDFLHYGIIQSFIVRTQYLATVDDIWKHGILLEEDNNNALIESGKKEIKVKTTVSGKELMQKIRNLLHELQDSISAESVSLDGVNFVSLEKLKKHPTINPVIESEGGESLEFNSLSIFLNLDENAVFQKQSSDSILVDEIITRKDRPQPTIYISYSWGGDSGMIVDKIDIELQRRGITVIRDIRNVTYRGRIRAFMEKIGLGSKIIVVLSKDYLESENCMFELTQIYQNDEFKSRIFPVVLKDANIYKPLARVQYIKFWDDKIAELDKALKSVERGVNLTELQQELNNFFEIRAAFDKMAFILKDMNALNPEIHQNENFESLYNALIENQL